MVLTSGPAGNEAVVLQLVDVLVWETLHAQCALVANLAHMTCISCKLLLLPLVKLLNMRHPSMMLLPSLFCKSARNTFCLLVNVGDVEVPYAPVIEL